MIYLCHLPGKVFCRRPWECFCYCFRWFTSYFYQRCSLIKILALEAKDQKILSSDMKWLTLITLATSTLSVLPLITQPLTIGVVIMTSTLFLCLLIASFLSRWYRYVLFLIYVGGLLVIFAYVIALSPNTIFKAELLVPAVFTAISAFISLLLNKQIFRSLSSATAHPSYQRSLFLKECGTELVRSFSISILIGLACVLLINLIVVVKICFYQRGSLRPFRNS